MQAQIDIGYEQLVKLVKQLPKKQWIRLKNEVEEKTASISKLSEMLTFLLNAPTFNKKQLEEIDKARMEISPWRTK